LRRNGISPTSTNITANFELHNIPVFIEDDFGSYKTIQFKISGENAKQLLKINQCKSNGYIPYKNQQVEWIYVSTDWDSDSYILVKF
jgi:hypothetical protein